MKPIDGKMIPKMKPGTDGDMMPGRSKGDGMKMPKAKRPGKRKPSPFDSFDKSTMKRLKGAI